MRGYEPAEVPKADFVVAVDIAVRGVSEFRSYGGSTFLGSGMSSSMNTRSREEGLLVFDFIDVRESAVLWRTQARTVVSQGTSLGQLEEIVDEVVQQVPLVPREMRPPTHSSIGSRQAH